MNQLYDWCISYGSDSMLTHMLECDRSMVCKRCHEAAAVQKHANVLGCLNYYAEDYFGWSEDQLEKASRILQGHYPIWMGFVE